MNRRLLAGGTRLLVAVSLLAVLALPVQASQVRQVNLEQMTERAATIFAGRCVELSVELDPRVGRKVQLATFRVAEMFPDDAVAVYNLAGAHALAGDRDAALAALERDLELGDNDWEYLEHDAWFDTLRDDPRYIAIVETMKRRAS